LDEDSDDPQEFVDRVEEVYALAIAHMVKVKSKQEIDFKYAIQNENFEIKEDFVEQMPCEGESYMNVLTCDILETIEDQ
jgi:hypothetical protein